MASLRFTAVCLTAAMVYAAPKVNVTLYSESLCPDCIHLITGVWIDVWNTPGVGGTDGIIEWNQVVWGNAKLQPDNTTIVCQHGAEECAMNILQTCGIHHANGNVSAWLPFITCLENHGSNQPRYAQSCAETAGLPWADIDKCTKTSEGAQLELQAGAITAQLQPPHQFVPWVTLGSTPGTFCTEAGCDNLLAAVCDAYTGTKPPACTAAPKVTSTGTGVCFNPIAHVETRN